MDETFGKEHRIFLKKEIDHVFTMKEKVHVFPFLSHISMHLSTTSSRGNFSMAEGGPPKARLPPQITT